jgi:hypothetical protein
VRCQTSQPIEFDSPSGRNASCSAERPLTAGFTASRILSKASTRTSELAIGGLLSGACHPMAGRGPPETSHPLCFRGSSRRNRPPRCPRQPVHWVADGSLCYFDSFRSYGRDRRSKVSPEAHNPRVVTESNLSDGSKETSVGSMGFKVTTSKAPSGQLSMNSKAVLHRVRRREPGSFICGSYAGGAQPLIAKRSAALGAIDDRYCGPVRTALVG